MKKLLVCLSIFCLALTIPAQAEEVQPTPAEKPAVQAPEDSHAVRRMQREAAFDKRLGLTEEQKIKAKEIRIKGHEKLKPIFDQIKAKKQEIEVVKMTRIAKQFQDEKIAKINKEIKVLQKKAHDIRKENMKEFESILTRAQKRTLKQMKKEGRQRYHANHPCHKPMMPPQKLAK